MEKYLQEGYLVLGSDGETMLSASFIKWNRSIVTQRSNKGFRHLLSMLMAQVASDVSITSDADKKFAYPVDTPQLGRVEHILRDTSVRICLNDRGKIEACCLQTKTPPQVNGNLLPPGGYIKEGVGITIEEAIINASESSTPQRIQFFTLPKKMTNHMT